MTISAGVITISDRGFRGEREDKSGVEIVNTLKSIGIDVNYTKIIPDEVELIRQALIEYADIKGVDLILTTGGTGVSPRDVTPDATLQVIDKEVPGMAEAMRRESAAFTPHAMISRAVAGIRGRSLIINLPGSPRGVRENIAAVLPALQHAVDKIKGDERDCGSM